MEMGEDEISHFLPRMLRILGRPWSILSLQPSVLDRPVCREFHNEIGGGL